MRSTTAGRAGARPRYSSATLDNITFRALEPSDLPTLHEWLQRPHVAEWWRYPRTLEEVESEYLPVALGESTTLAYIVSLDDQPIGFIQSYVVKGSGDGWWEEETDPGARGIDQFLCNADQLNRGLGRAMVEAFAGLLLSDHRVTKVQADPSLENERAIRSYERAGFRAVREVDTPDGRALLMIKTRTTIISGGQTGVDRGALDAALALDFPCGGVCPEGRLAEDGTIPARYPVTELPGAGYSERTLHNVLASDATVLISPLPLSGGTLLTHDLCVCHGKPHLVIDAASTSASDAARMIAAFTAEHGVRALNVAGPRASHWAGGHAFAYDAVLGLLRVRDRV